MSERPDDPDARQRRLDALRSLAHDDAAPPAVVAADAPPEKSPEQPHAAKLNSLAGISPRRRAAASARGLWRRWRAPALVIVAAVVIFGVVIGAILQNSGLRFGPKPPPALVGSVIALSAAGSLSCPSAPVWSPDGKQLAVFAVDGPSPAGCISASAVTDIQRSDSQSSGGGDSGATNNSYSNNPNNGPPPDKVAIFDAASGHVVRTITLPTITNSILWLANEPCSTRTQSLVDSPTFESLSWSPDGRSIGVFFTYTYDFADQQHYQARGLLIVVSVDGASAPRTLIATGRIRAFEQDIQVNDVYSPPRFTWDLAAGTATYDDVHRSGYAFTAAFTAGYRLGNDGALTMDQQAQAGNVSPWHAGILDLSGPQGAKQLTVSYQTSQWLWSPDSRYALPNLDVGAYMGIAGVTVTPPAGNLGLIEESTLAPPDAASAAVIKAAVNAHSEAGLARNPDGKLLAALMCAPSGAGQLTIRNIATGAMLAQASHSYPLTSTSLGCAGDLSPIAWSPDGARIATTDGPDGPDGQIIVWRVNLRG